jgi:phosphoribosylanthranilate isomerase
MKVKICGITTLEDALHAIEAGADMLGFNFFPKSPRFIDPQRCAAIVEALRGSGVVCVGVFVNLPPEEVRRLMSACSLDLAQLSGDEPACDLAQLDGLAFKALRPAGRADLEQALQTYPPRSSPPAYLVDAFRPGMYGGSGQPANLDLAADLAHRCPILLAGGLTPENVAKAIALVQPWGVDVASGVETAPGRKDTALLRAFVHAARSASADFQTNQDENFRDDLRCL